jgi:hypothetical protein
MMLVFLKHDVEMYRIIHQSEHISRYPSQRAYIRLPIGVNMLQITHRDEDIAG